MGSTRERVKVTENNLLGEPTLSNIPAAPKGELPITVCCKIDANDILTVSAKVEKTGQKEKITINNSTLYLNKEEIEMMRKNAEKNKSEDRVQEEGGDEDCSRGLLMK